MSRRDWSSAPVWGGAERAAGSGQSVYYSHWPIAGGRRPMTLLRPQWHLSVFWSWRSIRNLSVVSDDGDAASDLLYSVAFGRFIYTALSTLCERYIRS